MKPQDVFCCSEATGGESILALRIAIEGKRRHARPEDWEVLLQGHHEAFISWAEYLKNQETLMHNRNQLGETVRGAARSGKGLLAGLLRCGRCGKKMRVRYGGRSNRNATAVYYQCTASQGQPE